MAGVTPKTYVLHLKTDATSSLIELNDDSLEFWQGLVGGNIESVPYYGQNVKDPLVATNKWVIICNEEGMLNRLPKNPFMQSYVGDIVICQLDESDFVGFHKGELSSLPLQAAIYW